VKTYYTFSVELLMWPTDLSLFVVLKTWHFPVIGRKKTFCKLFGPFK